MVHRRLAAENLRTAVLTISTSIARQQAEDAAGPLLAHLAEEAGAEIEAMEVITDDYALIEDRLHHYVDDEFTFVFTTGGTGLTPDDVTPEATKAVIEREAPGIAEAMRAESRQHTPMGILARGMAGVAHRTLIVNFPGNPKAVEELFPVIAPVLMHAAETLVREGGRAAGGH
jgi:molybdopterin adenylyltransferase